MKSLLILCSCFVMLPFAQAQTQVAGVSIPGTFKSKTETLQLNGAGLREKYWIDLYVGALYLPAKSTNGTEITNADKPMAVKLHIISSKIHRDNMVEAIHEGFIKSTGGNTGPLKAKIDQLLTAFTSIKVGYVFDLVYEPGVGTSMFINGKIATTITGHDFKKALFGIWLGPLAVDDNLKKGMLSGK